MIEVRPLPMKEAIEFWAKKTRLSPREFNKLSAAAKQQAFGVAGIAKGAELESVYNALGRAISKGATFADFKEDCQTIFEKRGWTGERAWRVDNIFRTNVQGAYQSGRYRQLMRVAKKRPIWQYDAIDDSRTRPAHNALDGKCFPYDHPFWDTWYPLNGYRCRCTVRSHSERGASSRGLKIEERDPTGSYITPVDKKTGKTMPPVAIMPDAGFAHNPGKTFWNGIVDSSGKPGKWTAMEGLKVPDSYRRPALRNIRPADIHDFDESMLLPAGKKDAYYKAEFTKRYGQEKVITDAAGDPVILSLRSYLIDKTPGARQEWKFGKAGHGESIPLIEDMILHPYEIWLTPQQSENGKIRLSRRYICIWKTSDKERIGGLQVFEVNGNVFQGVTSFLPRKAGDWDLEYVERQRCGLLLYKGEKGR